MLCCTSSIQSDALISSSIRPILVSSTEGILSLTCNGRQPKITQHINNRTPNSLYRLRDKADISSSSSACELKCSIGSRSRGQPSHCGGICNSLIYHHYSTKMTNKSRRAGVSAISLGTFGTCASRNRLDNNTYLSITRVTILAWLVSTKLRAHKRHLVQFGLDCHASI